MAQMILSLDGGGIRGAATAQFLNHIEKSLIRDHNSSLRQCVDFYAGTSTGSIIALALATTDLPMSKINIFYNLATARKIFMENRGWFEIDGINAPKYEGSGKTKTLKAKMGGARLGDVAEGKHVLAVAYDIIRRKPDVIKSTDENHRLRLSYEVADSSSAAPTYFPTQRINLGGEEGSSWLVDGGVTANNPAMCAIAEMRGNLGADMDDIRLLSIGTGYRTISIDGPASVDWGAVQWYLKGHILDVITDERVVSYQTATILRPGNYIRVNAELRPQPGMDHPPAEELDEVTEANIRLLREMGDWWFEQYGEAAIDMMLDRYQGPSLERIEAATGRPKSCG